jgi:hypothetical protein
MAYYLKTSTKKPRVPTVKTKVSFKLHWGACPDSHIFKGSLKNSEFPRHPSSLSDLGFLEPKMTFFSAARCLPENKNAI